MFPNHVFLWTMVKGNEKHYICLLEGYQTIFDYRQLILIFQMFLICNARVLYSFLKLHCSFDKKLSVIYPFTHTGLIKNHTGAWWPIVANFNSNHRYNFKPQLNFIFRIKIKSKLISKISN